uniref:phage baseplate protein n=1 Tax=uncultured Cetobacterium sp. TaxID=527638 RepID=UPI0026376DA4
TLTTNFTDAINAAKEALRLDIAKKLDKGTYSGKAEDLKADIDTKEPKFIKNSGFNKVKTDLAENDTNKVFSAKGAFDLKTWLVTNYTTLMNNIRENLTNMINTKTPHGGYNRTSQDLKNEVDSKLSKNGGIATGVITMQGVGIDMKIPRTSGGFARGFEVSDSNSDEVQCGIGYYGAGSTVHTLCMGFGTTNTWFNGADGIKYVKGDNLYIKNFGVYHQGFKPTSKDTGSMSAFSTIPSGTDLNTIKYGSSYQSGTYKIAGSGYSNLPIPTSGGVYGTLLTQNSGYTTQIFTYVDSVTYIRTTTNSSNDTWTPWSKVYTSNQKPTASEIGAIPNEPLGYTYGFHNGQVSFGLGKGNEIGFGLKADGDVYVNYSVGSGYKIPNGFRFCSGPSKFAKITCGEILSNNSKVLTEATYCPYRVGDIITTTNTTHPATTWPGTQWERYGDGKVVVGLNSSESEFNSVGKTGGTKTESLTEAQNGPHGHTVTSVISGSGWYGQGGALGGMGSIKTTSSGTGAPHNNLQPYIVAYRWRRTA